jgi:hypothetical protein
LGISQTSLPFRSPLMICLPLALMACASNFY